MKHLFDAELQYRPGMAPVVEEGDGQLIGSGDGWVEGPAVKGTLRWTLARYRAYTSLNAYDHTEV